MSDLGSAAMFAGRDTQELYSDIARFKEGALPFSYIKDTYSTLFDGTVGNIGSRIQNNPNLSQQEKDAKIENSFKGALRRGYKGGQTAGMNQQVKDFSKRVENSYKRPNIVRPQPIVVKQPAPQQPAPQQPAPISKPTKKMPPPAPAPVGEHCYRLRVWLNCNLDFEFAYLNDIDLLDHEIDNRIPAQWQNIDPQTRKEMKETIIDTWFQEEEF